MDESGLALPVEKHSKKPSVFCVVALIIPSEQLSSLENWFVSLEKDHGTPIKGSKIKDINLRTKIIQGLRSFDVFVECSAIDMRLHTEETVSTSKQKSTHVLEDGGITKNPIVQSMRKDFAEKIKATANQLYLQAVLTWNLVGVVLEHSTIYYSQKRPEELAAFDWVFDAKEAGKVTTYEKLWSEFVYPYLQSQPPFPYVRGHDYSFFEKFYVRDHHLYQTDSGLKLNTILAPLDLKKILSNLSFADDQNTPCLRLTDVLANTLFQCLNGSLGLEISRELGPLFFKRPLFKRPQYNSINLIALETVPLEEIATPLYKSTITTIDRASRPIWL